MAKTDKITKQKPVLHKSVFQVRYYPKLAFYSEFDRAAQHYIDSGYPHWQTDRLKVTIFDPSKRCSIGIAHDSFSYSQDSHDLAWEQKQVAEITKHLPAALSVNQFIRFGFRRWYLVPVEMSFDSLVSILRVKLFTQDKRLTKIFSNQFEDVAHVAVTATGPYKFRTLIGPMRQAEVPGYLNFNKAHHLEPGENEEQYIEIKKEYPDVCFYLDIDFFRDKADLNSKVGDLTPHDLDEFIDEAHKHISSFVGDLVNYIFATEVIN